MTMAMQAVNVVPMGPKVLRIGVIQAGKIVEERIIRKRETVSIGSSERNHFVMAALPPRFELFQLVGNDYILNFTDEMKGRVGLPGGVQDLQQLRQSGGARNAGTYWQVKLSDSSRGKVTIGDTTLLFQFVTPPPVTPRPQLPAAARGGFVKGIDWVFTAFVTFSFMIHFGFIIYLENADWPLEEGIGEIPEEISRMLFDEPPPPPVEEDVPPPDETPTEPDTPAEQPPQQQQQASRGQSSGQASASRGENSGAQGQSNAEATARMAAEAAAAAEQLLVGALGGGAESALNDVLRGGAVTGNAADVLAQASGVGVAAGGTGGQLRSRGGGGTGSGEGGGLGSLAAAGGAGATQQRQEGTEVVEVRVRGNLRLLDNDGDMTGSGDFDQRVVVNLIRQRISAIRACYERELRRNPQLNGKVTVEFTIQTTGTVSGVRATENTTGDDAVAACVVSTVQRFRFNPGPEGGSVTFSYPFVFAPQN